MHADKGNDVIHCVSSVSGYRCKFLTHALLLLLTDSISALKSSNTAKLVHVVRVYTALAISCYQSAQ
jgi:hypothetical protein